MRRTFLRNGCAEPITARILTAVISAVVSAIAGVSLYIIVSLETAAVFLILAGFFLTQAMRLRFILRTGRYLILIGTVLEVKKSHILRKPQMLRMKTEEGELQVCLHSRRNIPETGDRAWLYLHSNSPIYIWKDTCFVNSYLALVRAEKKPGGDKNE